MTPAPQWSPRDPEELQDKFDAVISRIVNNLAVVLEMIDSPLESPEYTFDLDYQQTRLIITRESDDGRPPSALHVIVIPGMTSNLLKMLRAIPGREQRHTLIARAVSGLLARLHPEFRDKLPNEYGTGIPLRDVVVFDEATPKGITHHYFTPAPRWWPGETTHE